jgi:hypothetical protein
MHILSSLPPAFVGGRHLSSFKFHCISEAMGAKKRIGLGPGTNSRKMLYGYSESVPYRGPFGV